MKFLSCRSETCQWWLLLDGHVHFDLLCIPWQKDHFCDDQKVSAVLIFTSFFYSLDTCCPTCSDDNGTVSTLHKCLNFYWTITDHWFQYSVFIFRENESCVFMQCCCPSEPTIVLLGCSVSTCAFNSTIILLPIQLIMFWSLWTWKQVQWRM